LDEPNGAYIFTIQTPRQYAVIPRPEGNFVMLVSFIVFLVNIVVPLLFIAHLCRPYVFKISVGDFVEYDNGDLLFLEEIN
jgi:Na+-translocating ferredoxin:NAD+ oxidoreductase RnfD subunit